MTDEEILFDFHSVEVFSKLSPTAAESLDIPLTEEDARIQADPIQPGQTRTMAFEADRAEFKQWYEENIGPWTMT